MPGLDPSRTLSELLATMHTLRAPGGCAWDREQTPCSLAPYILEEACETVEAIESGTPERVADELGDLLLQIVFQAEIFAEQGLFDFADVAAGINAKLRRRHPHVFGDATARGRAEHPDLAWERIKREEQAARTEASAHPPHPVGRPPEHLPALQRAQKLIGRMRRLGYDVDSIASVDETEGKLNEEQLAQALLAIVSRAEACGLDAEQLLRNATRNLLDETAGAPRAK